MFLITSPIKERRRERKRERKKEEREEEREVEREEESEREGGRERKGEEESERGRRAIGHLVLLDGAAVGSARVAELAIAAATLHLLLEVAKLSPALSALEAEGVSGHVPLRHRIGELLIVSAERHKVLHSCVRTHATRM